jgi:general secretion pathway protein H
MIAPDPREAGLTLVEMLVVLAIVGVMAGLVVLSAGSGRGHGAEIEARRLAARLDLAADEAMVTGRPVAFIGSRSGYRFLMQRAGQWRDETAPALEPYSLPSGLSLEGAGAAPVVIGADGGGTPLDLRLVPAKETVWAVAFDGVSASAKAGG